MNAFLRNVIARREAEHLAFIATVDVNTHERAEHTKTEVLLEQAEQLKALRAQGLSIDAAGERLGLDARRVRYVIERAQAIAKHGVKGRAKPTGRAANNDLLLERAAQLRAAMARGLCAAKAAEACGMSRQLARYVLKRARAIEAKR